ncbi:MAG TPA: hypothetical protein ENN20_08490 [Candidatus Marinimicrobia bacterium]|nr:hypothetical protein [Candidatus Neomarinimicrobiota bacterium]
MKIFRRFKFLLPVFLFSSLTGQALRFIGEYPTANGLIEVVVKCDSTGIVPELYVFADRLAGAESVNSAIMIRRDQTLLISGDNHLLGLFSPAEPPANHTEPRPFEFYGFSNSIQPDFIIRDSWLDTGRPPTFFPNTAKEAVLQVTPNGDQIKFYNRHGRLVRTKRFAQNQPHNYETPLVRFNADGSRLVFFTRKADIETGTLTPMLYLLSPIGEEIWQTRIILKTVAALAISESGRSVAVAGQTLRPVGAQAQYAIFIFDSTGRIQNSLPYRAIQMAFNPAEDRLLIRTAQTVQLIDLQNEGIIFAHRLSRARREIADLCFLDEARFIISLGTINFKNGQPVYDNPAIRLYLHDGRMLAENQFPETYSHRAKIIKSRLGNQIGFSLQNRFIILQVTPKNQE